MARGVSLAVLRGVSTGLGLMVSSSILWFADVMTRVGCEYTEHLGRSVLMDKTDNAQAFKGLQGGVWTHQP